MNDDKDPIIDSLLEELLGDSTPPDLTDRILRAHEASSEKQAKVERVASPENAPRVNSRVRQSHAADARQRRKKALQFLSSAAVVVITASLFGAWAINRQQQFIAENAPPENTVVVPAEPPKPIYVPPSKVDVADNDAPPKPTPLPENSFEVPPLVTEWQTKPKQFVRLVTVDAPSSDQRILAFVDRQLEKSWRSRNITPTKAVDDQEWFERASQLIRGRKPLPEEETWIKTHRDREAAIDIMLSSSEFAQHWGGVITGMLVKKRPKFQEQRDQLRRFVAESIRSGSGIDKLAFDLIAAVGSNEISSEKFNPAVNFLLDHQAFAGQGVAGYGAKNKSIKVAAAEKVSQVFLGRQIQCAQCHDHGGTTQQQYHELAAFFSQMRLVEEQPGWPLLVNDDFIGQAGDPDDAPIRFASIDGKTQKAYPRFVGVSIISKSGRVSVVDRRATLANLIVASDDFSRSFVNRVWKQAVGYGFTAFADDLDSPISHPELLDRLAAEFKNSEFKLEAVLKWIALSSAFERDERSLRDPAHGKFDNFASFSRRRSMLMFPVVNQGLQQIAKARRNGGSYLNALLANVGPEKKKLTARQKAAENQRMAAASLLSQTREGRALSEVVDHASLDDRQKVIHLFLMTVGRTPNQRELQSALNMLKQGKRATAMQDLCWVLLNNNEFVDQH